MASLKFEPGTITRCVKNDSSGFVSYKTELTIGKLYIVQPNNIPVYRRNTNDNVLVRCNNGSIIGCYPFRFIDAKKKLSKIL